MRFFQTVFACITSAVRAVRVELFGGRWSPDTVPRYADRSRSTRPKDILGVRGERMARERLAAAGYKILESNIILDRCEIDIIARDRGTLVFVEVKTRSGRDFDLDPADAVDERRQARMIHAARVFRRWRCCEDVPVRFDIVAIVWPEQGDAQLEHIRDAFRP